MLRSIYTFTFGLDHVLLHGIIRCQDPALGGVPLRSYYVPVFADNENQARAKMAEAFGPHWSSVYSHAEAQRIIARWNLKPLFDPQFAGDISEMDLCDCGTLNYPRDHGKGMHDE
jgi:hypothetical protein